MGLSNALLVKPFFQINLIFPITFRSAARNKMCALVFLFLIGKYFIKQMRKK